MRLFYNPIVVILLIFISFHSSFGEGTKEIYPAGGGFYKFYLSPSDNTRNRFALYTATEPERLNITILNPNEVIFFGFNDGANTNNFKFRIKDASGTIVYPETQVPTSGQGYIATLAQARTGPSSLFAGGYSPRRYIAATPGVYYMEFTTGSNNTEKEIEYLDITISNPDSTAAIPGRVWSKGWQCTTTGASEQCQAKFYAYSDDQIVTAVNFNGMRPYAFDISCNSTGCNNTNNFIEDRKSRPGRHLYPQYKLFLNNPDSIAFPTGVLGQIDSVNYTSHCNGTVDFKIWVNKDGSVELLLDIYPPAGYSAGDVKLPGQVVAGTGGNIFTWDGKDGNGVTVPNGASFFVTTSYLNGLTHLPLFDSEYNLDYNPQWQGYLVSLVRPTGTQPALYWDDGYCGGGSNFAGCTNPTGCHVWGYNVGNVNTINTWWFAVSTSSVPITLLKKINWTYDSTLSICDGDSVLINGIYRKVAGNYTIAHTSVLSGCDSNIVVHLTIDPVPVVELGADFWICEGQTHTFDAGAGVGYSYQWDNITTSTNNIGSNQTYTTGTAGFYRVTVTTNKGCHKSDSVHLFVNPKPHLTNNPFSDTICSTFPFNITLTSNVPGTNFSWIASLITGNVTGFSNGSGNVINQVLTNNLPTPGKVQYKISPIAGGCAGNDTNYFVIVKPKPNVTTSPLTYQVCSEKTTSITLTSTVAGATFSWTASGSSGSVTGYSVGTGLKIEQTLINSSFIDQTVTYKVVAHAAGCSGDTSTFLVTVRPKPDLSNNPASNQICNNTSTNVTLTSNVAGAMFTWKVTGTANVTGFSDNTTPTTVLNQTLINGSYVNGTVTYRILPWIGGCSGDSTSFLVTVYPVPDLSNNPATKLICNNTSTNVTLTSNVSGTLFTWTTTGSSGQVSGYSDNSTPTTTINQILINTGFNIETVSYRITPLANGCSGIIKDYIVNVAPVPDLSNNPPGKSQCNNTATNLTLTSNVTGTQFTWTATGSSLQISGYSDNSTPTTTLNQTLVNSGFNIETVTYHLTPHANGCDGPLTDYVVTVFPTPDLSNTPKNQQQCNNQQTNITLTSNVSGTLFTWTCTPGSANISGFTNSTNPVTLINQPLVNSGYNIETVTYHITPLANGCNGNVTDYVVTVYPTPDLSNNPKSRQQCNNLATNITLTSNVTGSLFTWTASGSSGQVTGYSDNSIPTVSLNQTLVNSGFSVETVTYHITPHANGCDGSLTDFTVTVYPTPDMANTDRTDSICDSVFTNINLTSHVSGTQFTWRAFGSSPLVTGYSNSASPGILISQRLENNSFVPQTVTYRLLPSANGCSGDSVDYVVTVFPRPNLSNSVLTKEICNNNNTNIALTSNVAGTLFTWTCTPSSVNITGYSNSVIPLTQISQNLINTGDTPETVTYHITPQANGCTGWVYHFVVTVIPSPYLTNTPLRQTQCNNQNTNLTLTSNVAGTQFTWTATSSSPSLTGYSGSVAPGTLISQTLTNSGFNIDSVTYHITPNTTGCSGSTTDYNVVVFPTPDVFFVPNGQTVCEGVASGLSLQSHVSGTTYSWTTTASSPNLSGYSNGTGNMIVQTISNAGATTETVTYHVTPQANGCPPGITQNVILTVKPRPVVTNATTSFQICNSASTAISLLADVPGSTFAWGAFGSSSGVSGFSNGTGFSIIQTLVNTGFSIESVTYRVAATASACPGDSTDFTVTVYPVADAYFTPPSQAICPLQTCNININSHVAGTTYTWTASGSSLMVSGYSAGSGNVIQQTLNNTGYNIETVTYLVAPTANGCAGSNNSIVVFVDPNPFVTFNYCWDPITTTDAQPIKLKGASPLNGTYSGTAVIGNQFYPAVAGAGTFAVTYSYTNLYGCSMNASQSITVIAPVSFSCGNTLIDIRDNQQYPTVQIGAQCWMAANLMYGNTILSSQMQRDNCIPEKYCYGDNPGNCTTTGGLYQWDEVMKFDNTSGAQGYCPPGWHIPTESQWGILFNYYISNGFAGSPLKYTGFSGFNAFLSGIRFDNISWNFNNFAIMFWSSTSRGNFKAWAHGMNTENPSVSYYPSSRSNAFPVRCIKD